MTPVAALLEWTAISHVTATEAFATISYPLQGPYLAGYHAVESPPLTYGLQRLDHAVGNVHKMQETLDYLQRATGFHQFAEFTAEVCPLQKFSVK